MKCLVFKQQDISRHKDELYPNWLPTLQCDSKAKRLPAKPEIIQLISLGNEGRLQGWLGRPEGRLGGQEHLLLL